jgi:hypothetical protein
MGKLSRNQYKIPETQIVEGVGKTLISKEETQA